VWFAVDADDGALVAASSRRRRCLSFRPGLPLADVIAALRWENPVAWSGDVHMSSWKVHPHRPGGDWRAPHLQCWFLEVRLEGWPRGPEGVELPELGRSGPSPTYDVRTCTTKVASIRILKVSA
jgi:hypothetical protein